MKFPFKLPSLKPFDAAGFGLNAVDHLVVVPEYPAFDTKTRFLEHLQSAGGQTASAMVGLQRLGMKTAYAGRFGSDREGAFGLESLRDEGIDVSSCEVIQGARTQTAFILIDSRSGERTIVWDRDPKVGWREDEAPLDFASLAKVLHIDAHDPQACTKMAIAAHNAGAVITGDFDSVEAGLIELLPHVDVLLANRDFASAVTGIADQRASLAELHSRYGIPVVGMTLGELGALVLFDGIFIDSPAFTVPDGCRDTTGAGDAFHAGLIYGILNDESVEDTLRFANATAALKCRALGARTALPNKATLDSFMKSS